MMLRTPLYFVGSSLVVVGFAAFAGCSSGGSGGASGASQPTQAQAVQYCNSLCAKENTCNGTSFDCTQCATTDAGLPSGVSANCNADAYLTSANSCFAGACGALSTCLSTAATSANCTSTQTVLDAGNLGTIFGGDGAAPSCTSCAKAPACCVALEAAQGLDGGDCAAQSQTACERLSAANQTAAAEGCAITVGLGALASISACQ